MHPIFSGLILPSFLFQKQYIFIYKALLEASLFGDTEISACALKKTVDNLKQIENGREKSGLELEFDVSTCPEISITATINLRVHLRLFQVCHNFSVSFKDHFVNDLSFFVLCFSGIFLAFYDHNLFDIVGKHSCQLWTIAISKLTKIKSCV